MVTLGMMLAYVNIYFLYPKFILKKKYVEYVIYFMIALFIFYAVRTELIYLLINENVWPEGNRKSAAPRRVGAGVCARAKRRAPGREARQCARARRRVQARGLGARRARGRRGVRGRTVRRRREEAEAGFQARLRGGGRLAVPRARAVTRRLRAVLAKRGRRAAGGIRERTARALTVLVRRPGPRGRVFAGRDGVRARLGRASARVRRGVPGASKRTRGTRVRVLRGGRSFATD